MLKHLFCKLSELFQEIIDTRHVSVPLWRPWRDF